MRGTEISETYFQKEELLIAIRQAERAANWSPFLLGGIASALLWAFDWGPAEEGMAILVVLAFAVVYREVFTLKAMLLKAELREVSRVGLPPADREIGDILNKIRRRRR